MEIREKQSIFTLFAESFAVANRAGLALIGSFFIFLLIIAIPTAVVIFANSFIVLLLWKLFFSVSMNWWGNACTRILAAKAEKTDESVSDAFFNSLVPTIYIVIFNILIGIVSGVCGIASAFIPIIGPLLFLPVAIFFGLRLMFAPLAINLREQNPISAFSYSWELTSGRFFLLLGSTLFVSLFYMATVGLIAYGIIVGIPLYFADSFSLAHLSIGWIFAFAVIALILLFLFVAATAFFVLLFLNLDYGENRDTFAFPAQTAQPNQAFGVPSPNGKNAVVFQEVPQVQVVKASVQSEADNAELHQHLDKVYTPRPDETVESPEEDRMPTILFDDDMAKQLEERQNMWQKKAAKAKKKEDDDDSTLSIKISK